MAAGLMRMFGGTTKQQFLVLGILLTVLGLVGASLVIALPNEDPASMFESNYRDKFLNGSAVWGALSLFLIACAGILLIGTAVTGLPLVHMARYHVGVFYVAVFSLLLLPAAIAMRMGATLVANASSETTLAEGILNQEFASPAGWVALGIGAMVMVLAVIFLAANLLNLARVSYRPSLVRGGCAMGLALVLVIIMSFMLLPFVSAVEFDYERGTQGAVGFEAFDSKDITITPGWVKWLAKGENSSTYGDMAFWLGMMAWFAFFALCIAVVGFIGLALYSANDRKPFVVQLSLAPVAAAALAILMVFAYFGFATAIGDLAEKSNISSENTKLSYNAGMVWISLVLAFLIVGVAIAYAMATREWLRPIMSGGKVVDPISMNSLVDPPTSLPPPPTGWPAKWDKLSNGNYIILGMVAIVLLAGMGGGFYVKKGADTSTSFNPSGGREVIVLENLNDEIRPIEFADYATEGTAARPLIWNPDGTWFIYEIDVVVNWRDEDPIFRHENQDDVFQVVISATTGETASGDGRSNPNTLQGEARVTIKFDQYILMSPLPGVDLPPEVVEAQINVTVECTEAGDETPIGGGFYTNPDNGNQFSAIVNIKYLLYERM